MNESVSPARRLLTLAAALVIAGGFFRMVTDERPVAVVMPEPAVPADGPDDDRPPEGVLAAALIMAAPASN